MLLVRCPYIFRGSHDYTYESPRRNERESVEQSAGNLTGIIRRAKSYDESAFTALYQVAVKPVYRYLAARVSTVDEAEELTQDVFMAMVSGIKRLRAEVEAGLFAWLFQIGL